MPGAHDRTLTIDGAGQGAAAPSARSYLFLALQCDRPLAPPARFALDELDEVVVGRGAPGFEQVSGAPGARRLHIRVKDAGMSTQHACLSRVRECWQLADRGSKNGTLVNGLPMARALLGDQDLFELGHTLFVFRDALGGARPDRPSGVVPEPLAPGLATLLPALERQFSTLGELARSVVSMMILGETGTGKELAARAVHTLSGRAGPFVAINCGALPETLVESELYGYRKGAFSGAVEDRLGLVRSAEGGTLFLDEIGDLPPVSQAAFLRFLQEREVTPLGATRPLRVDVRVVAATNRDLRAIVADGSFREDLLARLQGFTIRLPPLRERRMDLGLLTGALLLRLAPDRAGKMGLSGEAARALFRYRWPLNIRELAQSLEAALALAHGPRIELEHLPQPIGRGAPAGPLPEEAAAERPRTLTEEDLERREQLILLLSEHGGNISAVSRAMGKARMQIWRWLKRYGLDPQRFGR